MHNQIDQGVVSQPSHIPQVSVAPTQPIYQPKGQTQVINYDQGLSYQVVVSFPPFTSHDEITKKLQSMEQIINNQCNA